MLSLVLECMSAYEAEARPVGRGQALRTGDIDSAVCVQALVVVEFCVVRLQRQSFVGQQSR